MNESKKITTKKDKLESVWHPTEFDESDELEEVKRVTEEYQKLLKKKQALIDEIEGAKKIK